MRKSLHDQFFSYLTSKPQTELRAPYDVLVPSLAKFAGQCVLTGPTSFTELSFREAMARAEPPLIVEPTEAMNAIHLATSEGWLERYKRIVPPEYMLEANIAAILFTAKFGTKTDTVDDPPPPAQQVAYKPPGQKEHIVGEYDWMKQAACRYMPTAIFYTGDLSKKRRPAKIARAKRICASCPVRRKCLEYAIVSNIKDGIYGGATPEERRYIISQRK